jgi:hypothetical protein
MNDGQTPSQKDNKSQSCKTTSENKLKPFVPPTVERESGLVDGTAERTFFTDSVS